MKKIKLILLFVFVYISSFTQEENVVDATISPNIEELVIDTSSAIDEKYEGDLTFMIQSIQTMLNLLGDPEVSRQDKDQMINQSYLKYFENEKVQIEDDLDPQRQLPINKNVQAYLQDVVFFYKNIHFSFKVKDIKKGLNDKDEIYFKVSMEEHLEGINLYGEALNEINDRYFEFNLNEKEQEFKVVSIYTTKLSEQEDIATWWNELDLPWRKYFCDEIVIHDSLSYSDLLDKHPMVTIGDTLILNDSDTVFFSTSMLYSSIKSLFAKTSIIIVASDSIVNLDPLNKFTELSTIDFSDCAIDDVSPLRSTLSLKEINAANSLISNLNDLLYLNDLKKVNIDNTVLNDLGVAGSWANIEVLSLKNSPISDFSFLASLTSLLHLNMGGVHTANYDALEALENLVSLDLSGSDFNDLTAVGLLLNLTSLRIDDTPIRSLDMLNSDLNLEIISFDNTSIDSIGPLVGMKKLKMIYCDNTKITQETVQTFVMERPEVLVVYETQSLQNWWVELDSNLKDFIRSQIDSISEPLSTELLHRIIFTESVDLSEMSNINSLEGFQQLINLKELNISGTNVSDLSPISGFSQMSTLNINQTQVADLFPIAGLANLSTLSIEKTVVKDLKPLESIESLKIIKADSSAITQEEALRFSDSSNAVLLYQSEYLLKWWGELDDEWLHFFSKKLAFNKSPSAQELQELVNVDSLVLVKLSGTSIDAIEEFKRLKHLKLDDMNVSDMSVLPELDRLETLVINNGKVSDFASIQQVKKLTELDLANTSLNNLDFIAPLANLKVLKVSSTAIESIKPITLLANLEYLDLSNTRVKRINYLNKLESLKEVKLTNTIISQRKISSFQRIRPDVKVVFY